MSKTDRTGKRTTVRDPSPVPVVSVPLAPVLAAVLAPGSAPVASSVSRTRLVL
jgi:hypothetical protein